jgi:nitrate/TMAO reductase-like tetraheme cytochrome c subunit
MQLANGDVLPATVNPAAYSQSVHGNVLQCTACHPEITGYPHPARDLARPGTRDIPYLMRSYANCGSCHAAEYDEYVGSVHAQALSTGKSDSAVCSDCHGAHDIGPAKISEAGLPLGPAVYACAACHQNEFDQYKNSAHGKAALEKGDTNVATCVDCHGAHNMHKAKESQDWRAQSVALCSSCHANARLMIQYGLSTEILTTYVADFHGTSAQLFPTQAGKAPEQALCYDCHGSHDIQSTVGANGMAAQDKMVQACQHCHPDANTNFPAAWLGHYPPSPDRSAVVFWIRGIYNVLVAGTVLLLVGHITLDIGRVLLNTLSKGTHSHE